MSSVSFARIMYGSNEDFHIHAGADFASRTVNIGIRSLVVSSSEHSSGNPAMNRLLRFARLFLDGKGE